MAKSSGNPKDTELQPSETEGFDNVFNLVGGAGCFQWFLFFLVSIQGWLMAYHHVGAVYLAYVPEHWCRIPELEGSEMTLLEIRDLTIPPINNSSVKQYDSCKQYDMDFSNFAKDSYEGAKWSLSSMENIGTRQCSDWVYNNTVFNSSVVTQFNLVCDRGHLVALIQASYMGGVFAGSLILGSASDKLLGRRNAILIAQALMVVFGFAAAFAPYFWMFILFRFLIAAGTTGSFQNCFVLLLEHSDTKYRGLLGIIQQMPFAGGYMALALYGYFFREWDHLQLSFAVSTLVLIVNFWILPESARWLASRGRDEEAIERINYMAKWNKKPAPPREILYPLLASCRDDKPETGEKPSLASCGTDFRNTVQNYFNLVGTPELRRRSLSIWFLFSTVAFVYYGIVLDSAKENVFLMVFLGGLTEVPAYLVVIPLVSRWGRRPSLITFFALTGALFIGFGLTSTEYVAARMTLSMLGKLAISSCFGIVYLLGAELYPTSARTTGLGAAVLMGRFGSILVPYIVQGFQPIHRDLPTWIFGIGAVLGAIVAAALPETKDEKMADSLTQVEVAASKKNKKQNAETAI